MILCLQTFYLQVPFEKTDTKKYNLITLQSYLFKQKIHILSGHYHSRMVCCPCYNDLKDKDEEKDVNNDSELQANDDSNDILTKKPFIAILGDPYRLLNGYDVSGDVCGSKNSPIEGISQSGKDLRAYKYIYFISNNDGNIGNVVESDSLEKSSNSIPLVKQSDAISFFINRFNGITFSKRMCRICVKQCPEDHSLFLNRCVPSPKKDAASKVFSATGLQGFAEGLIADIEASWREVIYMCLIALGFSIIMSLIMRFFVGIIVYIVMGLVSISFVGGTIIIWVLYALKKKNLDKRMEEELKKNDQKSLSKLKIQEFISSSIFQVKDQEELNWILAVLKSRIQFVIQLFKEASKAIQAMPFLVLQPFWTFLVLLIFLIFWTLTLIWFESSGYPEQDSTSGFVTYKKSSFLIGLRFYNFFGLFWISQFIIACQHVVIAGAISKWFFSRNKSNLKSPILKSIYILLRYHLGSVALGSFIIALIKFIRAIVTYFQEAYESMNSDKHTLRCPFMDITFVRQQKGPLLGIVAPTILCGLHMINKDSSHEWISRHIWAPVGLGGIFSYIIACCFISVYEMAIDTTFICFCEDCEMNNGESKPYFMNVSLMNFVSGNSAKSGKRRSKSITESFAQSWLSDSLFREKLENIDLIILLQHLFGAVSGASRDHLTRSMWIHT
ncbi:SLC44A1 [Lepeophtheirus salmonis]|uniref:Choline transporter-like protein n=1 Tax=Lepeophtheirus salmonis TaxID=72036 RepID=A0A7R8CVJ0_LEPSM|nr:SLC44A1 [Lepeophtheirus salmonis]CAF2945387.1 SLC44A1 [Lepeophtheirus salmonis]